MISMYVCINIIYITYLRFLYDGRRITDEHTPESLEMETGKGNKK